MVCTTLNVIEPVIDPSVSIEKYGFAEIEGSLSTGFANRFFETPCEENDIVGSREAVGVKFAVKNADTHPYANIKFLVTYLRPGDTAITSWSTNFTLATGLYERFIYHTDLKYIAGEYSRLAIQSSILK